MIKPIPVKWWMPQSEGVFHVWNRLKASRHCKKSMRLRATVIAQRLLYELVRCEINNWHWQRQNSSKDWQLPVDSKYVGYDFDMLHPFNSVHSQWDVVKVHSAGENKWLIVASSTPQFYPSCSSDNSAIYLDNLKSMSLHRRRCP